MGKKRKGNYAPKSRDLIFKEDDQEYAKVITLCGSGMLEALCNDGTTRKCKIRGAMYKRVWINKGDIILLGLRDFEDEKCDVIHKYTNDEVHKLDRLGCLSKEITLSDGLDNDFEDDVCFEEGDEVDIDDI